MFTIPNKLRTIVALGAVGVALAGSGAASAAPINPQKVGSAGIAGYDDAACESLANLHNSQESVGQQLIKAGGDPADAAQHLENAGALQNELDNNCLVID